ncbi:hypothetical protein [Streptomyces iconiensis]|uniref:Uncharacterized protein n=1 Tax=Streptomyces iconiensis TaxID=1384038 RepID=A0ABT7A689_9ACTN|nr:hypothetical protein [Streptomyces iconiensis]MDJ1136816.1 hypothetical protein [Streptomyces iconiensis]
MGQVQPGEGAALTASAWVTYINTHRIFNTRLFIGQISVNTNVYVSLCEVNRTNNSPFLGNASMKVYNVVPYNGFADVRGEVDWDEDIRIRLSIYITP